MRNYAQQECPGCGVMQYSTIEHGPGLIVIRWKPCPCGKPGVMEVQEEKLVTISEKRYNDLMDSDVKLILLEQAGVDNWDGYVGVMEEYYNG